MEKTNDIIDRISTLPDAVRAHIISFLSTKEAVGTCVLSKGWMRTWACVTVLDINSEEFRGRTCEEMEAKFERFLKGVLQNREPFNLEKFKLVWYTEDCVSYNPGALEGCILQAIKFKPRVLSLSVCWHELYSLDASPIFTCASLRDVVFEQDWRHLFEIAPSSVHLPCLKKLHLTCMIVNDDFADKLFFGCPILEELFLHDCILNIYKISSGKLKNLIILDCCLEQSLKISTPVLLEFEVRGCCCDKCSLSLIKIPETFSRETMASLINARIEFLALYNADALADVGCKLLTGLSNMTSLDLHLRDSQLRELLEKEVSNCPIFNNLKTLILGGWCMSRYFELVVFFLRSPNLQGLTLYNNDPLQLLLWELEDGTDEKSNQEETIGALFQREQLEIVKIIKSCEHDKCVDQALVDKLHAHIKTIGKIIII